MLRSRCDGPGVRRRRRRTVDAVADLRFDVSQVGPAVESARDAIARLATHPANRRGWATSAAAAGIRAARASAALDGADPGLDPDASAVADPVLAGAIRCSAAVGGLAETFVRAPLQAVGPVAPAGRGGPGAGGGPRSAGTVVSRLVGWSGSSDPDVRSLPGPVLVAVVHGEVLAAQAFPPVDGVVARAAARVAMVGTGLDVHALGVPEVRYFRDPERYRRLAAGYATGAERGGHRLDRLRVFVDRERGGGGPIGGRRGAPDRGAAATAMPVSADFGRT